MLDLSATWGRQKRSPQEVFAAGVQPAAWRGRTTAESQEVGQTTHPLCTASLCFCRGGDEAECDPEAPRSARVRPAVPGRRLAGMKPFDVTSLERACPGPGQTTGLFLACAHSNQWQPNDSHLYSVAWSSQSDCYLLQVPVDLPLFVAWIREAS